MYEINCMKSILHKKITIFFGSVVHTTYTDLNIHVCVTLSIFVLHIKYVLQLFDRGLITITSKSVEVSFVMCSISWFIL